MQAKKCDRCGKLYETPKTPRQYRLQGTSPTKSHYGINLDLCDSCHTELKKWFELPLLKDVK